MITSKRIACLLVIQSLVIPMGTFAQAQARHSVSVPGGGWTPVFTGTPGTYQINNQETTQMLNAAMAQITNIQQSDKEYLDSSVRSIDTGYNELVDLVVNKFQALSQKTISQQAPVPSEDYYTIVNQITQKKASLDSRIVSLSEAGKGALPSVTNAQVAGQSVQIPNFRNVNMEKLVSFYNQKISDIISGANNLPFTITFKNSSVTEVIAANSGDALNHKFNVSIFSSKEIDAMTEQIKQKRTPPFQTDKLLGKQSDELRGLIQTFVTNYGTNEKYRLHDTLGMDAGFEQRRADQLQTIVLNFWSRSYLRAKYGIRLGALQPAPYQKRWLNIDKFAVYTEALRTFRQERAETEQDLMNAKENVAQVLNTAKARTEGQGVLDTVNRWMTIAGGRINSAEAIVMVMNLVAADIDEEYSLAKQGRAKMFEIYKSRYQGTPESAAFYTNLKCDWDSSTSQSTSCANRAHANVVTNSGGGLRVTFNDVNLAFLKMGQALNEADAIEKTMMAALMSGAVSGRLQNEANEL